MTIPSLDPSGELSRLFSIVHSPNRESSDVVLPKNPVSSGTHDAVALSAFARDVRDISARAAAAPDLREARVQDIQRALAAGEELAGSQQIADALARDILLNHLARA